MLKLQVFTPHCVKISSTLPVTCRLSLFAFSKLRLHHFDSYCRVKLTEGTRLVSDSGYLLDQQFRGGRLGVFIFSQKHVVFSKLSYKCDGE